MIVSNLLGRNGGLNLELPKFLQMEDIADVLRGLYLDDVAKEVREDGIVFDDERAMKALDALPPADVVPGHCYRKLRPQHVIDWLPQTRGGMIWAYSCSHCGHLDKEVFSKGRYPFCPMCGGVYMPEVNHAESD